MTHLQEGNTEKVKKIARATIDFLITHPQTNRTKITNIKAK
ncbi:MAG: hypothetical protein ACFFDF_11725, partial [Candidatus Odinarchaeota archaeon]